MDNDILALARFDQDGFELFVDENTGFAYASISATARMIGRNESTIRAFITSRKLELLEAEVPTSTGLKTSQLLTAEQVFKAAVKYNSDLAEKMGTAGANVCLCGMAGYQVAVIPQSVKPLSAIELHVQQAQLLLEVDRRQQALELSQQQTILELQQVVAEQQKLIQSVTEHDAEIGRIFQPDGALITLAGYLNLHGKHATAAQLAPLGKVASSIYRDRYGCEPEQIGDARYGKVNAYPQAIAHQVLADHGYLDT
jgi:hypothetical protein